MNHGNIPEIVSERWYLPDAYNALKICLIGAGKMSRFHLETFNDMPGVQVEGISSQSGVSGEKLAREFNIKKSYTNWQLMLEEGKPDAVFVAVTHDVSPGIYRDVLKTGIPCMLEKPGAYSSGEAAMLAEIAEEHNCKNMIGLNRRFYSNIQQALIEILHHGPVTGISIETNEPLGNYRSRLQYSNWVYNNWLIGNSMHGIDLFRMIGGEIKDVASRTKGEKDKHPEHLAATIEFENGILGTYIAHFNSYGGFGIKIYGEGVTAELMPMEQGYLRYSNNRTIALQPDVMDLKYKAGLYAQNAAFLQNVMNKEKNVFPVSDMKDHVKTLKLIESILGYDL